ncbi:MAG TPA: zf-HC2 domain-containing protein [Bryobacteraceae bacterium]|nr:zf-HC2 domain-containing protein [Bryobacteraceae bacterium]
MNGRKHTHEHGHNSKDPHCLEVFARLSAYLDGELTAGDCADVEAHIADCPPCVEFLQGLRKSIEASHHFKTPAEPDPVDEQMRARLQKAWTDALARRSHA